MSAALIGLTIEETAAGISRGDFTSTEVFEASLKALDTVGRKLNAVARLEPEFASKAAARADATERSDRGPLHGVVLAHKDLYLRDGWTIEAGSRIMAGHKADQTAHVVTKLDRAGTVDSARLNTVEFALGISGHNEITGHVQNPWDPAHITGGSSSGSAAAVAAGCIPAALGSDTGGSIRLPAAACGLVGIKPTFGLVSRSGVVPLSQSLDTVGPLTRNVRDAALVTQAIAGHDPSDPFSVEAGPIDYLARIEDGAKGLRIGVPDTYFFKKTDDEILTRIDEVRQTLSSLGASLQSTKIDERIWDTNSLTTLIISAEAASIHAGWIRERASDYGPQTLSRLMPGLFTDVASYLNTLAFRKRFARHMLETTFRDVDLLLTPMWPTPIPRIDETDIGADEGFSKLIMQSARNTRPVNFLGFPSIVLPCGFTQNGLPASFQLVARPFEEATLFRAARAFERETVQPAIRPQVSVWN